eukprot:8936945-Heterocapsa_arctica.AAC.1
MIEKAFPAKAQALEHEAKNSRMSRKEQKQQAAGPQRMNSALEGEPVGGRQRSPQWSDESKDHESLRRQLARLKGLKKKVLEFIPNDMTAGGSGESSSMATS